MLMRAGHIGAGKITPPHESEYFVSRPPRYQSYSQSRFINQLFILIAASHRKLALPAIVVEIAS